jgi:hypothetical protein
MPAYPKGGHEIRVDVVAVRQIGRQRDLLAVDRIANLEAEIFAQRKAEPAAEAHRLGLVGDIVRRVLLLVEEIEPECDPIAQEIGIHERHVGAAGVLAVLNGGLSVVAATKQVALGDADLA